MVFLVLVIGSDKRVKVLWSMARLVLWVRGGEFVKVLWKIVFKGIEIRGEDSRVFNWFKVMMI